MEIICKGKNCFKKFKNNYEYDVHKKMYHIYLKNYDCEYCTRKFEYEQTYKKHTCIYDKRYSINYSKNIPNSICNNGVHYGTYGITEYHAYSKIFSCRSFLFDKIIDIPKNTMIFDCRNNYITTIENLPDGLIFFDYIGNPIKFVDCVDINRINFSLKGYQAIKRIQKRIKKKLLLKKYNIKILQEFCHDWIWVVR